MIFKISRFFYQSLLVLSLCTQSAMPMAAESITLEEKKNHVRKTLLDLFVKKYIAISIIDSHEERQASERKGDVFLSHNQYELIGIHSGHLLIVYDSQKSLKKIKVHSDAVSCIAAKDELVATASATCRDIHRWRLEVVPGKLTVKMYDKISCPAPIIFIHILENNFFAADVQGCIYLIDWKSGVILCKIETGVQPILNVEMDDKDGFIIITATQKNILVKIDLLIKLDKIVCSLNENQIEALYQIICDKNYTKITNDGSFPYQIIELFRN